MLKNSRLYIFELLVGKLFNNCGWLVVYLLAKISAGYNYRVYTSSKHSFSAAFYPTIDGIFSLLRSDLSTVSTGPITITTSYINKPYNWECV
jgi:hypothetical protein